MLAPQVFHYINTYTILAIGEVKALSQEQKEAINKLSKPSQIPVEVRCIDDLCVRIAVYGVLVAFLSQDRKVLYAAMDRRFKDVGPESPFRTYVVCLRLAPEPAEEIL